jgi:protein AIR1/2
MCGEWGHVAAMCHQIWRFYRAVDPTKVEKVEDVEMWCYNCAGRGHLGDDCTRPRPFYVQGGRIGPVTSAFGEANVPEWVKKSESSQSRKRRKDRDEEEEDENDWFRDRERRGDGKKSGPPNRKIGTINLPSSKNRPPSRDRSPVRPSSSLADRINRPLSKYRPPSRDRSPVRPPSSSLADRISGQRGGNQGQNSLDSYRPSYAPKGRDSYVPRYRDRDQGPSGSRDWDEKMNHWKRNRDSDRRR